MADMPDYGQFFDEEEDDSAPLLGTARSSGGSALTANRSVHGKATDNTFNQAVQCYANVGAWAGGRRDLCIVSGSEVALCSWRTPPDPDKPNVRGERAKNQREKKEADRPTFKSDGKIADFISEATKAATSFTVLAGYTAPGIFKFTDDTEALVFLPDSHMNMFRESFCDAFSKPNKSAMYGKESLVKDLVAFLDFYKTWKQGTPAAKLISLGDFVDIWHTQAVCLEAHRYLQEMADQSQKKHGVAPLTLDVYVTANGEVVDRNSKQAQDMATCADRTTKMAALPSEITLRSAQTHPPKGWPEMVVPSREIALSNWPAQTDVFDAMALFVEKNQLQKRGVRVDGSLKGVVVDYSSYQSIEAAIKARYPEMTSAHWALYDKCLRGNHDMDKDHPYMKDRYRYPLNKEYREASGKAPEPKWKDWDDETPTSTGFYGNVEGKDKCIWIEHGHAFDPYNHRQTFYREDTRPAKKDLKVRPAPTDIITGGFMTTLGFVRDAFKQEGKEGIGKASPGSVKYQVSGIAGDVFLEFYAYHRTRKIFDTHGQGANGENKVNLVIMGHTHVPHLEDFASWQSGWRYVAGAVRFP